MMTASSVEFFPCRVQLMGLPRSANTSATATSIVNHNETTASLQNTSSRPQRATILRVSRNLFGAPDPVEINNIYQQEEERKRSYILQRYNFDIKIAKPTSKQSACQPTDSLKTTSTTNKHTQLPTLIEQELKQHEQRLQTEQLNLNRSSETILSKSKIASDVPSGSKILRGCSEESLSTITFTAERQKPYSRQSLLTDNFNIRKNKISRTSYCKQTNAKMINFKSELHSHHKLEVIQLPQALQAHEEPATLKQEEDHKKVSTANDKKCADEDSRSCSSSNNCNNCSALSLKIVVTSQNTSSVTTSDASNPPHTHQA